MKISFKNIPMFLEGNALPTGQKKHGILTFDPNGNNIWYADDWNNYHTWHSSNIVNPWLAAYQNPETVDWESYIKEGLDSWNNAGGFDWLEASPEQRLHRMNAPSVLQHQLLIYDKYRGIETENERHKDRYNYPMYATTSDRWIDDAEWKPDTDFGIHTGNRRPSIHINSDEQSTRTWDNYYKKLGYLGAYKYLDHWIPTKDKTKVERNFGDIISNPSEKGGSIPVEEYKRNRFDWNKLGQELNSILTNPKIHAAGRLIGNLINNERVYNELKKGINPDLLLTYRTHRQVVGDEATKQAYYRRAAAGETRAARPFTSDADRQIAYRNEAKVAGDELRARGDLADNQEIRRTSDESNLHEWANILRATEVANTNRASINKANAMKHNLLALKHSADWTSIDNAWKGEEYDLLKKQKEEKELADLAFLIDLSLNKYNDQEYLDAYKKFSKIAAKHKTGDGGYDESNEEFLKALIEWRKALAAYKKRELELILQHLRNWNNSLSFLKNGTKITYKRKDKDDMLYKSTKDAVEHFRKMSKMSSDALNRKEIKIKKLASHPKGNTKKYLLGGVAPFTVYTPISLGDETTKTTQTSTSDATSKKSGSMWDNLDLLKELFKNLGTEGLPSDVNSIYVTMNNILASEKLFGSEAFSTDNIAGAYISQMRKINMIKFNKALYDKALDSANNKDALSEYALDDFGNVAVQNLETGEISFKSLKDIKESDLNYNILTNMQLLNMRAYSPDLAFNYKIIEAVTNNGVGMSKIADFLKSHMSNLGSTEQTVEGFTKVESDQIKKGFEMLKDAPTGDYKFTNYTKLQKNLAELAINYLKSILPRNMKNVLEVNAQLRGTSVSNLITALVGSTVSSDSKLTFEALTGKGAKNADGTSKESDLDPSVAFFMGLGERNTFIILDKTRDGLKIDTISMPLLDENGHGMSNATLLQLKGGRYSGLLNTNSATMGGVRISPNGVNNVLLSGGTIYLTELPIDREAAARGIILPNLSFLKNIEKADAQVRAQGITNRDNLSLNEINIINKIYKDNGLPIIYTSDGSGKPVLTSEYRRFAMVDAMATEDAFEGDMSFNDGAVEVEDDKERSQFESMMKNVTKNEKYKIDNGWSFGLGRFGGTSIYKGIVYIPMVDSTISALAGTGYKGKSYEYNEIERKQQLADFARKINYNPGGNASNLNP